MVSDFLDLGNELAEFHRTPIARVLLQSVRRKESAAGGHCANYALISAIKLNAYIGKYTPVGFPAE
jgi:hypothetical protein